MRLISSGAFLQSEGLTTWPHRRECGVRGSESGAVFVLRAIMSRYMQVPASVLHEQATRLGSKPCITRSCAA